MLKIIKNADIEKYLEVTRAVEDASGFCPCGLVHNEDTKCICKKFLEQQTEGECHCGRFVKIKQ